MSVKALLDDYRTKHADDVNLRRHYLTVPVGALGLLTILAAVPLPWPVRTRRISSPWALRSL
jgi:hypothetical protein